MTELKIVPSKHYILTEYGKQQREAKMTQELKIEASKFYTCSNGAIAHPLAILQNPASDSIVIVGYITRTDGKQAPLSWDINGRDCEYGLCNIVSEYQEEPKVGWVYEDDQKIPFKIVYWKRDGRGKMFLGVNLYSDDTNWFTTHGYHRNIDELKLETGRLAEEI